MSGSRLARAGIHARRSFTRMAITRPDDREGNSAMSRAFRSRYTALRYLAAVVLTASPSLGATWMTNVAYGGSGPTMDLYVPDRPDASPGIVVALHYCG